MATIVASSPWERVSRVSASEVDTWPAQSCEAKGGNGRIRKTLPVTVVRMLEGEAMALPFDFPEDTGRYTPGEVRAYERRPVARGTRERW